MIKRLIVVAFTSALLFSGMANATLIDNGDGTVTATTSGLMWLKDANLAYTSGYVDNVGIIGGIGPGSMNWYQAHDWINYLNSNTYLGYNDWRLPEADNSIPAGAFNVTGSEFGNLYYTELGFTADAGLNANDYLPDFQNVQIVYYTNTDWEPGFVYDFMFLNNSGWQGGAGKTGGDAFVWAVRDVNPVPEPTTMLLLGSGLIGLAGFRRKFRNR